jgi:hypothetical protein
MIEISDLKNIKLIQRSATFLSVSMAVFILIDILLHFLDSHRVESDGGFLFAMFGLSLIATISGYIYKITKNLDERLANLETNQKK